MRKRETSRMHAGNTIEIRNGSEGPRHDPYGYTEITVRRLDGRRATIHIGLGEWLTLDAGNGERERRLDGDYPLLRREFEAFVGITPEAAEKAFRRIKQNRLRRHACGQKHLEWVSGFPGEELLHCSHCGTVLDASFSLSAVE